ncbi:MAG: hypothetical protein ACRDID_02800 [Ktedonobacterales bacterium]
MMDGIPSDSRTQQQAAAIIQTELVPVPARPFYLAMHDRWRENVFASFGRQVSYREPHTTAVYGNRGCELERLTDSIAARLAAQPVYGHKAVLRLNLRSENTESGLSRDDALQEEVFAQALGEALHQNAVLCLDEAQALDPEPSRGAQRAAAALRRAIQRYNAQVLVLILYWLDGAQQPSPHGLLSNDIVLEEDSIEIMQSSAKATRDLIFHEDGFAGKWLEESHCRLTLNALDTAILLSPHISRNKARLQRPYQTIFLGKDLTSTLALCLNDEDRKRKLTRWHDDALEELEKEHYRRDNVLLADLRAQLREVETDIMPRSGVDYLITRGHVASFILGSTIWHIGETETPEPLALDPYPSDPWRRGASFPASRANVAAPLLATTPTPARTPQEPAAPKVGESSSKTADIGDYPTSRSENGKSKGSDRTQPH